MPSIHVGATGVNFDDIKIIPTGIVDTRGDCQLGLDKCPGWQMISVGLQVGADA